VVNFLEAILYRAIATTAVDKVALLRSRAHAAAGVARKRRVAALGLALVVLEHEQVIHTKLERGVVALQRLVRTIVAPRTYIITRAQAYLVKGTHRRALCGTRIAQKVVRETFTSYTSVEAIHRK
jgi:hypothetical protein